MRYLRVCFVAVLAACLPASAADKWFLQNRGYYDPVLTEPRAAQTLQPFGKFIAGSQRNHEPYGQVELTTPSPWTSLNFIVSTDIRDRTIYQYNPVPTINVTNQSEPTQVSVNTMIGVRQLRQGTGLLGMITPTYYLRYYHGVNPNGQFRSQDNFQLFGFGVQFGF